MTPTELISTGGVAISAKDREIRPQDGHGKQTGANTGAFETEMRRSEPRNQRISESDQRASDRPAAEGPSETVDVDANGNTQEKTSVSSNDATDGKAIAGEFSATDPGADPANTEITATDTVDVAATVVTSPEDGGETTNKIITVEENSHDQTADPAVQTETPDDLTSAASQPDENIATDSRSWLTEGGDIDPARLLDSQHEPSGTAAREGAAALITANGQALPSTTGEGQPGNGRMDATGTGEVKTADAPALLRATEDTTAQTAVRAAETPDVSAAGTDKQATKSEQAVAGIPRDAATTTPAQTRFMAQSQATTSETPAPQTGVTSPAPDTAIQALDADAALDAPLPDDAEPFMLKPATPTTPASQTGLNLMQDGQEAIVLPRTPAQPVQLDTQAAMNRMDSQSGQQILRTVPVPEQITVAVAQAKDGGRIELRLDPPDLGKVQIQLNTSEDGVRAVVMAEKTETQDLLRRHAELLARDLRESGFEGIELEFTDSSGMTEREANEELMAFSDSASGSEAGEVEQTPAQVLRSALQSGLDIRL